jgi:hypothetical protein
MTEVLPEAQHPAHDHQPLAMPATPPATATTHTSSRSASGSVAHRGREKIHWSKEVWDRLDHAVHKEVDRTRVAAKYLPIHRVPQHTTSVPSDFVIPPPPSGGVIVGPGPDGAPLAFVGNGAPPTPPVTRWQPPNQPPTTDYSYAVDEGATTRLVEFWVEFSLTPQQVEYEGSAGHDHHEAAHPGHPAPSDHVQHGHPAPSDHAQHGHHDQHDHSGYSTATTLATRAANILAQAEDMLLFNGLGAFTSPLYTNYVRWRANGEPSDWGLLNVIPALALPTELGPLPASQVITVQLETAGQADVYGEKTFKGVTAAYAKLMGLAQYGPYALTLHNVPYADSFAPLPTTLIMPADRITPLMTAGFRDSGTLDAPGATALAAGANAAAAAAAAGSTAAQQQQAAANAAAAFVINYGVGLVTSQSPPPTSASALAAAAEMGSLAAQAAGASNAGGGTTADDMGQAAAYAAANQIPNYPGLPQGGNPTPVAPSGLPSYYGSMVSLGGNTMDLVVGIEPTVGFMQQDVTGNFRFRVFERIALRLKDISAVIRLEFQ